MPPIYELVDRT